MESANILEVKSVSKSFPGVKALDKVQLAVRKGEIHALVGENGAGKSTLMKILSGVYTPDEGETILDGTPVKIRNPHHSEQLGISIVYQELSNFPAMSVAENIAVGDYPRNRIGALDYRKSAEMTQRILDEFELTDLKPGAYVRELSIGRQQVVEILKASSRNSKVLILDEPTSALTERETDLLFEIMKRLKSRGVSIIYISHRLDEIFRICDRTTVFRDGKFVITLDVDKTDKAQIVKYMVGRDVAYNYGAHSSEVREVLFEAKNIAYGDSVKDVSFRLHAGEVLGIAGLEGAGRTELVETLFGIRKKTSGKTFVSGKELHIKNPMIAKQNGIAYITKDRKRVGLFMGMSVDRNIMAANLDKFSQNGIIRFKKARENSIVYWKRFDIKTPTLKKLVVALSGGNQQKVLLAMWFTRNPRILIVDEPTRGIDVGTKEEIHKLIRKLASDGAGIIMISSDMPELLGASDRILVMFEGTVTGDVENYDLSEEKVVALASNELA
ncbi:Ribose import ATP-binding protein RbsA [bioreactor metagenome]|uniref:Ribose import ATP-binding protein RbsA n=1 Tax=bioreactor metagenome TaxID=1076179 RepID=A0A644YU19_9ZZZZ